MFEISAKAYCSDHASSGGPSATKAGHEDKKLLDVLREITVHLTRHNTDRAMKKVLHGGMAENGLLGGHYVEPYAGGAGVAMELLLAGKAAPVHLNPEFRPPAGIFLS